jgi:hypothetical protein
MADNGTHDFPKAWSLALAMVVLASCCTNCTPCSNKPAVINKFSPVKSEIIEGNPAELEYKITDEDSDIVSRTVSADYDRDGVISKETETDSLGSNEGVFITRDITKIGSLEFILTTLEKEGNETTAKTAVNVIKKPDLASVISRFEAEGEVKQGETGKLGYNITKPDGIDKIDHLEVSIDYDRNSLFSDDEKKNVKYFGGDGVFNTEKLNVPGDVDAMIKVIPNDSSGEVSASAKIKVNAEKLPAADLAGIDAKVLEGKQITVTLPEPSDEDTSGAIPYTKAEIIEGKDYIESILLNPATKEMTVKAKAVSQNQSYTIRLFFGTSDINKSTADLEGIIQNLCNISGQIKNAYAGATAGDLVAYADSNETDPSKKAINYSTSDGTFNVTANQPADTLLVRARFNEPNYEGDNKSFTREVLLDAAKDYSNLVFVCEPSPAFPVTKKDFAEWINATGGTYLRGWNSTKVEGIELLYKHPDAGKGEFTQAMQDAIAERCMASDGVEALFDNRISLDTKVQVDDKDTKNTHYLYYNGYITPHDNWIVVVPVYNLTTIDGYPCQGLTGVQNLNNDPGLGILNGAVIRLNATTLRSNLTVLKGVSMHEFNHAILSPYGEGTKTVNPYSVMGNRTDAGEADVKKAHMVYNGRYDKMEEYAKILGLKF